MEWSVLVLFIPTFFLVSATPGMCMTLALTMGLSIGLRRTFHMMWGELIGVGLVALAAVIGVATIMLQYPRVFEVFKYLGGAYLFYLGIQMWLSKGRMAIPNNMEEVADVPRLKLASQGFVTAVANPKGWAFMVSLLPPFIVTDQPLLPQLALLLVFILVIEFICLVLYAAGGRTLRQFLFNGDNVRLLNRISGSVMMAVGVWLALQ
ncbi:LysE family translocator [Hahella sp. CCB-MM4]|uniref:LysE family translocator n=1 Tax=Hahella sp. (strain CCB-MM4) TaxID=1926491 RepID=UPI001AEF78BA|nr:LysE family translocator [Hahella sp. CCB-MM4]